TVDLADWAIVVGTESDTRVMCVEAAAKRSDPRVSEARGRLADQPLPPAVRRVMDEGQTFVAAAGETVLDRWLGDPANTPDGSDLTSELRVIVPIASHGKSLGAILLGSKAMFRPESAEVALAEDLATRAGLA